MDAHRMIRSAAALALLLPTVSCSDVRVGVYASVDEARREGAIAKGWVPEGLPPSAADIREAHDLDTNKRWVAFTFPAAEAPALRALIDRAEIERGPVVCDAPARFESWPRLLRTPVDVDQMRALGFRLYRGRDAMSMWAIHWPQGKAFCWTP
jgi:hypothetical protein